eukprot:221309_1
MSCGKKHISVITIGDVNSGKSTLCGRLLYELGGFNDRDLNKASIEANNLGYPSRNYAFFMDKLPNERLQGNSIECTTREFFTDSYHYTLSDAPGNKRYIKNIIRGISQADVAIIVVSAVPVSNDRPKTRETVLLVSGYIHQLNKNVPTELELMVLSFVTNTAVSKELTDYLRICHTYGIQQLIVCVNKMDDISVQYDETIFVDIINQMKRKLKNIGYKTKKIAFIPISALKSVALMHLYLSDVNYKDNMKWYKGFTVQRRKKKIKGYSLIEAFETVIMSPKRDKRKPFIMPIFGVCKISCVGDVIIGRIEQGKVSPGTNMTIYPKKQSTKIFCIETHHKYIENGVAGDCVGFECLRLHKDNMPKVGDVLVIDSEALIPCNVKSFTAMIFVQYSFKSKMQIGETMLVWVRTARAPCKIVSISWKQGKCTNNKKIEFPKYIEYGCKGEINFEMIMNKTIVMFPFDDCAPFGRAVFMCQNSLVMIGKVLKVSDGKS